MTERDMITKSLPECSPCDRNCALRVQAVKKSYHTGKILDGISFDVERGELVVLLGPNGCGKSTLVRLLMGIEQPDEGEILFYPDSSGKSKEIIPGYVPQNILLLPWNTLEENVLLPLRARGVRPDEKIEKEIIKLFKDWDLPPNIANEDGKNHDEAVREFLKRYPDELSQGQRQRVAIIRAIVTLKAQQNTSFDPNFVGEDFLVMDEPLASADISVKEELHRYIEERLLKTSKSVSQLETNFTSFEAELLVDKVRNYITTILYITHDFYEAVAIADKVIMLTPTPSKVHMCIQLKQIFKDAPSFQDRLTHPEFVNVFNYLKEEFKRVKGRDN